MNRLSVAHLKILLFLILLLNGCSASNPWLKADHLFKQEKYGEAADAYRLAAESNPSCPELAFNRGTAQYMAEQMLDAINTFQDVAKYSGDELQERAEFNTGNAYLRQGENEKAIEFYKRALYLKPDDINAKWNLELAQKHQQQRDQQQGQQQQDQPEQKSQDDKQDSGDGQEPPQHSENQPPIPEQGQPEQQRQQPQPDEQELSQKEAERLLKALSQQDRDLQKELRKPTEPQRTIPFDKDW
jgi:Ca-activated chloride channel family protein